MGKEYRCGAGCKLTAEECEGKTFCEGSQNHCVACGKVAPEPNSRLEGYECPGERPIHCGGTSFEHTPRKLSKETMKNMCRFALHEEKSCLCLVLPGGTGKNVRIRTISETEDGEFAWKFNSLKPESVPVESLQQVTKKSDRQKVKNAMDHEAKQTKDAEEAETKRTRGTCRVGEQVYDHLGRPMRRAGMK